MTRHPKGIFVFVIATEDDAADPRSAAPIDEPPGIHWHPRLADMPAMTLSLAMLGRWHSDQTVATQTLH